MKPIAILVFFLLTIGSTCFGQQLFSGTVLDENAEPLPFAKLYVKNDADLRTICDENGYFEMRLMPGEYAIIVMFTGYDEREIYLGMEDEPINKNIQLFPTVVQDISLVEVSTKKTNPGRDIILEVVKRRDTINPWNHPHKVQVYTRATEKITRKNKDDKKSKKKEEEAISDDQSLTGDQDVFAAEQKAKRELDRNMNLVEVQLERNFAPKDQVKEFRQAYEERGRTRLLYYTTTVKSNFNFFENLMRWDDLHQTPVISPISGPGILSYKYRLVDQYEENGQKIHKIKIIPRGSSTSTLSGFIWVFDSTFMVQKLELTLEKGNLLVYDYFTISQEYRCQGDSLNVLVKQKLDYGVEYKDQSSACITVSEFKDYNFQPNFGPKYFNNELSVTEKEAYERDTSFWSALRTVELTQEERDYILYRDSIREAHSKKEYLDSIDSIFNQVTVMKVLWFGVDHRNRANKTQWSISSLAAFARPLYIAGPRLAPGFDYFKKWENEQWVSTYAEVTYGLLNHDIKGNIWSSWRYDPFHFGNINFKFGHDFDVIRSFDAITQIFKRSNFIETTEMRISHFRELFNGLYFDTEFEFSERRNVTKYDFVTVLDEAVENEPPTEFEPYQALLMDLTLSYRPGQKYMREPNRKVLLGSRWPVFYAFYQRGIPGPFGSDIDHEYGLIGMRQTFKIGTLGTSKYHIKTGKFLSHKRLYDADFQYHRRSDPFWFSNPLYSFQDLDKALVSKKAFFEGHFVHHDNGAIINKIPFMKKTGIGLVGGCGAVYVTELDWLHYEAFTGLERNFNFSKRKLRVGIYGVASDGNNISPRTTWKISFAVMDRRTMKWNF